MEKYQIITDKEILQDFIDNHLPDLQEDETYYVCLFARSKYCKWVNHISSDKAQLKRFTSNKERLIEKIEQLEIEVGKWKQRGKPIPQEALALYITINPRSLTKAGRAAALQLVDLISKPYTGWNPHQQVMSEIHKAISRKIYIDFDFDDADYKHYNFEIILGKGSYKILQTRGGFHLLVQPDKIPKKWLNEWYKAIADLPEVDVKGDNMIPIPGTYQGGFTPKFIKYEMGKI